MSKHRNKNNQQPIRAGRSPLNLFEPGGSRGPIHEPGEYEALIRDVTDPDQREFLEEASRFATTWEYLSTVGMDLPPEIAAQVTQIKDPAHTVRDRIARMRAVNQQLIEFLSKHDRQDSSIRQ